ncbi:MAG: alpha-ketoacid dehydrogenase subunit beta [Solirubrobacteraceae bacterium]|nr:alpha-ketoacid dehydrogenase subunit beta [Solirubrobacteraceae bacterium]
MSTTSMTYREALRSALREELERDDRVVLIGEDIGAFDGPFHVTKGLLEDYGERRVRDTPNAERAIVGVGAGAAMVGLRPVVELMTITSATRALDQLLVSVAQTPWATAGAIHLPLVVRTVQGGGRQLGPTHAHHLEAMLLHIPGLQVVVPSTPADAKGLLKSAIRSDDPVVVIEHQELYGLSGEVPDGTEAVVPIGQAAIRREGRDVTLLGISRAAHTAAAAADLLEREGVSSEVIDVRSLRPLDLDTIVESVKRTNRLVIVEDGWPQAGVAASIATLVQEQAFDHLDAPVLRVSGADAPVGYARTLESAARASAADVARAALAALYRE